MAFSAHVQRLGGEESFLLLLRLSLGKRQRLCEMGCWLAFPVFLYKMRHTRCTNDVFAADTLLHLRDVECFPVMP